MIEEDLAKYALQNSFAIMVTIYLLWERSKITVKVTDSLNEMSKTLAVISDKLKGE